MQTTSGNSQASAFREYYRVAFGDPLVSLNTNDINYIIQKKCLAPNISQRKVLVLYCHNEIGEFGQTVCEDWFNDDIIETLLSNDNFIVTGYNITRENHRLELIEQLGNIIRDDDLCSSISSGESKIYILVPYLNTVLCQVCIDSSYTQNEFVEELLSINDLYDDITQNLQEEEQVNNETQTCKTFQQIMFDKLGNKDFDVFYKDQHNFLKDKIGYAFFGPPSSDSGYEEKQKKYIEKVFKAILAQSEKYASDGGMVIISIIFVCCVKFTTMKVGNQSRANIMFEEFNPVPIFILRKCHPGDDKPSRDGEYCRVVIDNTLRVYTSWKKFLNENKYPECVLCTPKNGEYNCDDNGDVLLEFHFTPACNIEQKVLKGLDITSAVTGIGSGGLLALAAIPAITMAPVVITGALIAGVGTGVYAICRSVANIVDRSTHDQDLSFSDAEARAAYINIAAGALGFVGAGANALLVNMARGGAEIGQGVIISVNTLNGANLAAGGLALGNSCYDVARGYVVDGERPSSLVLVQMGASALFFGNAVYNFRSAASIVTETQNNTIQDIRDSLRSNRHRRTFTKMHKETIRVNNGDTATGNAKVISTIRNANNVDETMAILTRNNKRFNELGLKFAARDGHISLNGQTMDITKFATAVNKAQISEILSLPQKQVASLASKSSFNVPWTDVAKICVTIVQSPSVERAAINLLYLFRPIIQRKLIELVSKLFNPNNRANAHFRNNLSKFGIGVSEISLAVDFICEQARARLKCGSIGMGSIRVVQLLVNNYLCGRNISEELVNQFLDYVNSLLVRKALEMERAREDRRRIRGTRVLKKCDVCIGYYHYHNT